MRLIARCTNLLGMILVSTVLTNTALTAQTRVYISPRGVDQRGGGSAAQPFKTLTFAASQVPATGPTTFYMRPGKYDEANGEIYPIDLPDVSTVAADPAVVPAGSKQVTFGSNLALTATLRSTPSGSTANVTLRNLKMGGGQFRSVQMLLAGSRTRGALLIDDCELTQSRCVAVRASGGAQAQVTILDSSIRGADRTVTIATDTGSTINLAVERSVVLGGTHAGVLLDAVAGGRIDSTFRACRIGGQNRRGVYSVTDNRGQVSNTLEHCLLHDIARFTAVIGGGTSSGLGAIIDSVGGSGAAPQHTIHNCIFDQNKNDAPGSNPSYTWGANLVTQASLAGVGGNLVAAPTFVQPGSDYHLAPGSVGVDMGWAQFTTLATDLDGDLRQGVAPVPGTPDLGPDELWDLHLGGDREVILNRVFTLRTTTLTPNVPFAVLAATAVVPPAFGYAVHLAPPLADLGIRGMTDARGLGEIAFPVPNVPGLVGAEVYWQGIYAAAPFFGVNAWRTTVR